MSKTPRYKLPPVSNEAQPPALTPREMSKQEFGRRLMQMIVDRGWRQSDLARAAGVGRDSISCYVNGRMFPTPKNLSLIASALKVKPEDLIPNTILSAIESGHPAIEIRQTAGHPDQVWLRVNQRVTMDQAIEVAKILKEKKS